jgi:hypothetical protein
MGHIETQRLREGERRPRVSCDPHALSMRRCLATWHGLTPMTIAPFPPRMVRLRTIEAFACVPHAARSTSYRDCVRTIKFCVHLLGCATLAEYSMYRCIRSALTTASKQLLKQFNITVAVA